MAMDALSLELPNPVAKLGAICLDLSAAKAILERFAFNCSPRDNVLILCEVFYNILFQVMYVPVPSRLPRYLSQIFGCRHWIDTAQYQW
jgi:hypothetical protein